MAGLALLTNLGVLKLDWTRKSDSREQALEQMQALTQELAKAKTQAELEETYGKLEALEQSLEIFKKSGPDLTTVLPHRLIVDPNAEDADAMDAMWMMELIHINTNALNARYTRKDENGRSLIYKPTHMAVFTEGQGEREDGLGMVFKEIDSANATVTGNTSDERLAYIAGAHSECYLVWDKVTRRVMLFHRDDWIWPIWVWDDPFRLSRFFPYFITSFGLSTGGTVVVGETSYYLDQQDEINDINRQVAKIRRTIFDYWFYNSDNVQQDQAEKFVKAIRGDTAGTKILGIRAGEKRISDMFEGLKPPSADAQAFFNKAPIMETIYRITNTNDAMRGAQFKAGTTEDAVQTYQEAARLTVGTKVDIIEDTVADVANALAEMCVQFMTKEEIVQLIGQVPAEGWRDDMSLELFKAQYSVDIVAGSLEKPNSVFKKKEAVQIAQSIGQFAQAAPGAAMRIMLRLFQKAFTDVTIKPEDWASLDQEIQATLTKGVSTGAEGQQPNDLVALAQKLPPEIKQKVIAMKEQGLPDEEIATFIKTQVQQLGA